MRKTLIPGPAIVLLFGALASAAPPPPADAIPFDTHDGYFVSNKFEPNEKESFVVLRDQKAFDEVFGAAFVMRDKSHRLPKNAFDSKMVLAAIKRGKALWEFKVQGVTARAGTLVLRYAVKSEPRDSAEYACPLIVSIPKGDYVAVEFVENGKLVKKIGSAPAGKDAPAKQAGEDAPAKQAGDANGAGFDITCRKTEDRVTVAVEDARTVFSIVSPSGIGQATVQRRGDRWPETVVLRLRLRGLESLVLSCGRVTLSAAVPSHGGATGRILHLKDGAKEGPQVTKDSPYWMDIRVLDAVGKPATGLPPKDGCFETTLPKTLLDENEKVLTIHWIDFYRG